MHIPICDVQAGIQPHVCISGLSSPPAHVWMLNANLSLSSATVAMSGIPPQALQQS